MDPSQRVLTFAVGASVLLHAVVLSIHFKMPDTLRKLATPQTLGMATVVAAPALPKSAATPRTAWWSAFGDAQLNALVQQASMLAVNDIFMGSAAIFMLLIPSLWFAKRVGMVPPAAPAAQGAKVGAH